MHGLTRRAALIWLLAPLACSAHGEGSGVTTLPPLTRPALVATTSPPSGATSTLTSLPTRTSTTTSSTSTSSTTTSSMASTTSTLAASAHLVLSASGIGDAAFGTDPEPVLDYVRSILGPPTDDTGWVDAAGPLGTCPGTTVRGVRWGDLLLLFGDESEESTGRLHFFAYTYGPAAGRAPRPSGLATASGLGIGTTVTELVRMYPGVRLYSDHVAGSVFVVERRLTGNLTSIEPDGVVTALYGGISCGE